MQARVILFVATAALASGVVAGAAQQVPVRTLTVPEQGSTRQFTRVRSGVRELSDGSVLVIDTAERAVLLLDAPLATARTVGVRGSGPGEYLVPNALLAWRGDSTAIRDGGSGSRLVVVSPAGIAGATLAPNGTIGPAPVQNGTTRVYFTDDLGRLYASTRPSLVSPGRADTRDSAAIVRWAPNSPATVLIGLIPLWRPPNMITVGGMRAYPSPINVPFRTMSQWTVSRDGRVAFVHPDPFRAEIFDSTGRRIASARLNDEKIRVSDAHRSEWMTGYMDLLARENLDNTLPVEWPDFLPPFVLDAAQFDLEGRLWIHRTTAAGQPPTFDVLDNSARVVERVVLPPQTRLAGFGRGRAVYVVRADTNGFEYLERRRIR